MYSKRRSSFTGMGSTAYGEGVASAELSHQHVHMNAPECLQACNTRFTGLFLDSGMQYPSPTTISSIIYFFLISLSLSVLVNFIINTHVTHKEHGYPH